MLSDQDIKNIVLVVRRGIGIAKELSKAVAELFKSIIKAIDLDQPMKDNIKSIKGLISDAGIKTELVEKLTGISKAAVAAHPELEPVKPTKTLIGAALGHIMPNTNLTVNQLIDKTEGITKTSVINYVQQAKLDGWTNKQLKDALKTSQDQLDKNIQTIANTAVSAVNAETKKQLYAANNDVIDRVLFLATLDNRTTDICKALDGQVFKLKDAPSLPLHPNERSVLLPILKGEDADEVKKDLLPRPNVVPTGKDSDKLKGGTTYSPDYEAWLKKQPKYYQEDILGKAGAEKFRDGAKLIDVIKVSPITEEYLKKAI